MARVRGRTAVASKVAVTGLSVGATLAGVALIAHADTTPSNDDASPDRHRRPCRPPRRQPRRWARRPRSTSPRPPPRRRPVRCRPRPPRPPRPPPRRPAPPPLRRPRFRRSSRARRRRRNHPRAARRGHRPRLRPRPRQAQTRPSTRRPRRHRPRLRLRPRRRPPHHQRRSRPSPRHRPPRHRHRRRPPLRLHRTPPSREAPRERMRPRGDPGDEHRRVDDHRRGRPVTRRLGQAPCRCVGATLEQVHRRLRHRPAEPRRRCTRRGVGRDGRRRPLGLRRVGLHNRPLRPDGARLVGPTGLRRDDRHGARTCGRHLAQLRCPLRAASASRSTSARRRCACQQESDWISAASGRVWRPTTWPPACWPVARPARW